MPVTIQAPAHGQWFRMSDDIHLSDWPMATGAIHAGLYVSGMVEVSEIRDAMHPFPRNRRFRVCLPWVGVPTFPDLRKDRVCVSHQGVAVVAGLRRRHGRMRRVLDMDMTISAVQSQATGMDAVRKWYWLCGGVTDSRKFRRGIVVQRPQRENQTGDQSSADSSQPPVRPWCEDRRQAWLLCERVTSRQMVETKSANFVPFGTKSPRCDLEKTCDEDWRQSTP